MKNITFTKTITIFLVVFALTFTATAQTQSPTVGKYTGINAETFENSLFELQFWRTENTSRTKKSAFFL